MLETYYYLKKQPEIVKMVWEKCQTHKWNLSWDKLTSPKATKLFFATIANNTAFWNRVTSHKPVIPRGIAGGLVAEPKEIAEAAKADDNLLLSADQLVAALTGAIDPTIVADKKGGFQRHGDKDHIGSTQTSVDHSRYPMDIAVLGGTHPAALEDLSAKVLQTTLGCKKVIWAKKPATQLLSSPAVISSTNQALEGVSSGKAVGGLVKSCSKRPWCDTIASHGQVAGGDAGKQQGKQSRKQSRK
ncbi:hypothetical protein BDV93DRAFT_515273 [Ceratobasidium sp. AG-I]|nr:hypothetical protein BDV93DRAFT_515273 [Ceratobasidium sp. AG-I]